jgi:hypothetical protein
LPTPARQDARRLKLTTFAGLMELRRPCPSHFEKNENIILFDRKTIKDHAQLLLHMPAGGDPITRNTPNLIYYAYSL